jgi:cyclophilin family peptidyl-prolyl cis-trans isomerase
VSRACHVEQRGTGRPGGRRLLPAAIAFALALVCAGGAAGVTTPPSRVLLETTQGSIRIRLDDRAAPIAAANFRKLVSAGFYTGTYFHRALPAFVIQGGDPNTARNADPADDGLGGPGYRLPAEAGRPVSRGSVAMARLPDVLNPRHENDGSQFYIVLRAQPSLDGGTVFGEVISGLDIAERIAALAYDGAVLQTPAGANPQGRARILRATLEP